MLDLLEMKDIKPSDTRWLAHEWCVKAVKVSYNTVNGVESRAPK